jgi:PAS domain S-box-containing protein
LPVHTAAHADNRLVARPVVRRDWARLRFALYVLLLALVPVAIAYWAFARIEAGNEVERADARMNASLHAAVTEFNAVLDEADARALRIAAKPNVQRALADRNAEALVRLAERHPNVRFVAGPLAAGETPGLSATRAVSVAVGPRTVGRISVAVPLDKLLLERLNEEARLRPGDVLGVVGGGRVAAATQGVAGDLRDLSSNRPNDVRLGGETYRAQAAPLPDSEGTQLVVLRPRDVIAADAGDLRERIGLSALAMLGAVALGAYAGAPFVSRGVLALQQRSVATRVLSNVGDGVVLVGRDGVVAFWNRTAQAITGLRAEAVRGRRIEEVIPQWHEVAERVPVATRPGNGESTRPETIPLDLNGRERWLSFSGVAFEDGTVYTFRDVTEERRLEEARTDFVATVSHELRTPLAAIYGAALTLRRSDVEVDAAGREQLLSTIADQSDRLARIVEEILLTSRLAAGELRVSRGRFDADQVVRETVDAASARLPAGVRLEVTEPRSLPAVAGDGERARQVLANLIDNALKYSPDGGRIGVRVDAHEGYARFSVEDEGIGVPAAERERIFEKFYRLDPNLTRGAGGTGLGLYIARELVRRMNGRIWVTSQPGAGSTFSFELPFADRPSEDLA